MPLILGDKESPKPCKYGKIPNKIWELQTVDEYLLPERTKAGHPFSTEHRLGRVIAVRGYEEIFHFASEVDISPRVLSRYLAGEPIPGYDLVKLSEALDCPGEFLQEESNGGAKDPD